MLPIFLALAFIAILFVIVVAGQSDEFTVSRRTTISAPPEKVFPQVNELRNWESWNPWGNLDTNCKMTYDGPPAGIGASYAWNGNNKIGEGRNTITESETNERVRFRLEFARPMKGTNNVEFTFQPEGDRTVVTWTMTGKNSLGAKVFGLVMNCEKMCGDQFDKGLARMKSVVETAAKKTTVHA